MLEMFLGLLVVPCSTKSNVERHTEFKWTPHDCRLSWMSFTRRAEGPGGPGHFSGEISSVSSSESFPGLFYVPGVIG